MDTDRRRFKITEHGLVYVPRWIRQESDMEFGSIVTHENYNEKLNLNTTQGDYNTEILRILFTECDPCKVTHIPYLDEIIENQVNRLDDKIDRNYEDHQEQIDALDKRITENTDDLSDLTIIVNNIINGITKVKYAEYADKITGVDEAGVHRYYGTDYDGNIGFHEVPDSIYATEPDDWYDFSGIYINPLPGSITESMLSEELRGLLKRAGLADYDLLNNRPYINHRLLTGDMSLEDLGIQPAGNYITSIPDNYVTDEKLSQITVDFLPRVEAAATYATNTTVNNLINTVNTNKSYAEGRYARVCIGSFTGTPKAGDILVTL